MSPIRDYFYQEHGKLIVSPLRVASRSDNHVLLVLLSHPRVSSNSSESASSREYHFDEIRYFSLRDD